MNENSSHRHEPSSLNDDERMAGQSERGFTSTPLDHDNQPERYFIGDIDDPESLTEISSSDATKMVLEGKGGNVIRPWQLAEED